MCLMLFFLPFSPWTPPVFPRHRGPQPGRLQGHLADSERCVELGRRAAGLAALRAAEGGLLGHAALCGGCWATTWLGFMSGLYLCMYIYIIPGVSTTLRFGVVCKTPLFWVRLILFGVVSCKKGLLYSKQVLAIYTKHYQAKSCEGFVLVLSDVGSGILTHHSDSGAWLKLLGWTTLDPHIKHSPAFYNELRGQTFAHCDTYAEYTRSLSTSTRPDLVVPAAETVLTDGRTDVEKKVRLKKTHPPSQRPRKTWPFNFAEKDLLLLDEDLLLLGPFGSKVKMMAMDVQQ